MPASMLVTLDGSTWSEGILDTAARFAAAMQSTVYLMRLFPPVHDLGQPGLTAGPGGSVNAIVYAGVPPPETLVHEVETLTQAAARAEGEALDYLRPLAARFGGLKVECLAREASHTADAILSAADELSVDVIVMATHGRGALPQVVLGSVADAVVRAGRYPVLLFRPARAAH